MYQQSLRQARNPFQQRMTSSQESDEQRFDRIVLADDRLVHFAEDGVAHHLSGFREGAGPTASDGVYRLLDASRSPRQSNAVAFDLQHAGARDALTLRCKLRVLSGGDGGAFAFLSTREYGIRGPAPFVRSWVEPNLKGTFAVGIDVHNPKNEEYFGPWGNYRGMPEREVSLHWDGREIVKRIDQEFPLEAVERNYHGEVAERWAYRDGGGEIGVIASVSQPFCGDCHRARLTIDGKLVTCLFASGGRDLRGPLRAGASDADLVGLMQNVWRHRADRYSEIRGKAIKASDRVEMYRMGG